MITVLANFSIWAFDHLLEKEYSVMNFRILSKQPMLKNS